MGNCGLVVLEHEHQEHLSVVSLDKSRQDGLWSLTGLELRRTIRRTIVIHWMIDYLLSLLITTERSKWHTLFLLNFLMLPIFLL